MGDSIKLNAVTVTGATYAWSNPNGFVSTDQNPILLIADAADAGTYSLVVTANGCSSIVSTTTLIVNDCAVTPPVDFFIPEGFSPNSDGVNDLFVIRGIQFFPENAFTIFNRWGSKVFEASPYQNTWNGDSSFGISVGGGELPTGTYFYVLDLKDGSAIYKGTIYLNR